MFWKTMERREQKQIAYIDKIQNNGGTEILRKPEAVRSPVV
jgi:hypothetical protein